MFFCKPYNNSMVPVIVHRDYNILRSKTICGLWFSFSNIYVSMHAFNFCFWKAKLYCCWQIGLLLFGRFLEKSTNLFDGAKKKWYALKDFFWKYLKKYFLLFWIQNRRSCFQELINQRKNGLLSWINYF